MQNKFIKLLILTLFFSLQGFSQTTEKSKHPLLDKYYPQIQNTDTGKAVTTQIKTVPLTKSAPALTTTTVPAVTTAPALTSTTVPSLATTSAVTITPAITTSTINKPTTITPLAPVQKVQTQPVPPPKWDTRLGSSTKQYDTWEKNNNGAGSVTTSPK